MRCGRSGPSGTGIRRGSMATSRFRGRRRPGLLPLAKGPVTYHLRAFMDATFLHLSVRPAGWGRGLRRVCAMALVAAAAPAIALGQAAIDPNVAPRAAALEREGERQMAIDLLGHYLATAPDDGRAWLQ